MKKNSKKKIFITGSSGFVGKNLLKYLIKNSNYDIINPSSKSLNLTDQKKIYRFFRDYRPDIVIHLAARQGGIVYNNKYSADIIYENTLMNSLIINYSRIFDVEKFICLGAGTCYPSKSKLPLKEEYLFDGPPNNSHFGYSYSKRSMINHCLAFYKQYNLKSIILLPCNLYGPNDNFYGDNASVIPSLIRKIYSAKNEQQDKVNVLGNKNNTREFMYIEDFVKIIYHSISIDKFQILNVGTGVQTKITKILDIISDLLNYKGEFIWSDKSLSGQNKRVFALDKFRENFGNDHNMHSIEIGLKKTLEWCNINLKEIKKR